MLQLICIDVDGTLVGESGKPSSGVLNIIKRARSLGQSLALTTARGAMGPTLDYASLLNPDGWHIFHAGASLIHMGSGEIMAEELSDDIIRVATETSKSHGWALEYYSPNDYRSSDDSLNEQSLALAHSKMLGCDFKVGGPEDLSEPVVRLQFVVDEALSASVIQSMSEMGNLSVATSPALKGVAFISVTKRGVDKGSAIVELCRMLCLDISDVMMVGDGLNDLDALRVVGHPVAMGNAHDEVLRSGRYVVSSVEEDGLSEAIELSWSL